MMIWLLSLVSARLPDLWLLPALGAAALWLYGWFAPVRIAAEVVRIGALALVGLAVWLWCWSGATAACEARVAAATAAETARQQRIVGDALTRARAEGAAAMDAASKTRADLDAALDATERRSASAGCGLSERWVEALPK